MSNACIGLSSRWGNIGQCSRSGYFISQRRRANKKGRIRCLNEIPQEGIDSFIVCKDLRDEYDIPVILLGKDPNGEMWKKAIDAGADYYMRQPFSHRVLAARLSALLRRYKGKKLKKPV